MRMIWQVEFDERARKELRKLTKEQQLRMLKWLRENISIDQNPRRLGKPLKGTMKGLWRYRVGDNRVICQINDHEVHVLVLAIGSGNNIYR